MLINFKIDESKCIKCAKCFKECPTRVIKLSDKNKIPFIPADKEESCILCQHCLAVCPAAALSIDGLDPQNSVSAGKTSVESEQMENLIRCRRSCRSYLDENLDPGIINKMLEMAANAPTGVNSRSTAFSVINNMETMLKFKTEAMNRLSEKIKNYQLPQQLDFFTDFSKKWEEKKIDIIFRNAPHMIIAHAPKDSPTPETDCAIALSYFEIYAQTLQIGTLWCGMAKWLICDIAPELKKVLKIDENNSVGYIMLFGRPAVKYARGVQRNAEKIAFIKM